MAYELPAGIEVTVGTVAAPANDGGPLRLKLTYTNVTDAPITFVVYDTALEGAVRDDILDIRIGGQRLPYVGPIYKRRAPQAQDYVTLAPAESRSAIVVIDRVYYFDKSGVYSVRARQGPQAIGTGNMITLDVTRGRQLYKQAPVFQTCNAIQQSEINAALSVAERYARVARDDLRDTPVELRPEAERYAWWFGSYAGSRWDEVQDSFNRIYSATSGRTLTFDCSCDEPGVYAYVFPSQHYDIYLCPVFFQAPTSGQDSKAGTIIHEISHFNVVASTDDHEYGVADSRALALRDPNKAVNNADSLEYFAENPTNLSMPPPSPGGSGGEPPQPEPEPEPAPDYSYLPTIILLLLQEL